jgi:hypothetical protein
MVDCLDFDLIQEIHYSVLSRQTRASQLEDTCTYVLSIHKSRLAHVNRPLIQALANTVWYLGTDASCQAFIREMLKRKSFSSRWLMQGVAWIQWLHVLSA